MQLTLYFREVLEESFRRYTIMAKNSVAKRSVQVAVKRSESALFIDHTGKAVVVTVSGSVNLIMVLWCIFCVNMSIV
jgi:hypothetical protein